METWKKEREQREEFYEDAVSYYGRIRKKMMICRKRKCESLATSSGTSPEA
ncbi:MAG: hypothetical protein ACLUDU_04640 [Butyricimonas faecihominis]